MFSKVAGVARGLGCEVVSDQAGADLIFVDLNSGADAIAQVKAAATSGAEVVGFCGHEAKDVRQAAMEAGATLCVTNGTLTQTARRLITENTERVQ